MAGLYRQHYVLEHVDSERAFRYVCYEDLTSGKFGVAICEIITAPNSAEMASWFLAKQLDHFVEVGCDCAFDSLKEAVEDYSIVMENERLPTKKPAP